MTAHRKLRRRYGSITRQIQKLLDAGAHASLFVTGPKHEASLRTAAWRAGIECAILTNDSGERVCRVWPKPVPPLALGVVGPIIADETCRG